MDKYRKKIELFQQNIQKTLNKMNKQIADVNALQRALSRADSDAPGLVTKINNARLRLLDFRDRIFGSEAKRRVGALPAFDYSSPISRLEVGYKAFESTYGPTTMERKTVENGMEELAKFNEDLNNFIKKVMAKLERLVHNAGAPPIEKY